MRCPRCENTTLDEREREGVTIDVCTTCRGLWLDRGELEKLIARERAWDDDRDSDDGARPGERGLRADDRRDGRPFDDERYRKHKRKKSWLETLGDILD